MSLIFTHATENIIKAPALLATSETPWRGLPPTAPLSATWACYPLSLANDYYDIFSYGPDPFSGADYYMAATVNQAGGPLWNLGIPLTDGHVSDHTGPQVVSGRWYYQGFHVKMDAATGFWTAEYYYDLATRAVISTTSTSNDSAFFTAPGSTHALVVGDAPWAAGTAGTENWNGYMQGVKVWSAYLSEIELWAEAQSIWPVLPKYFGALWAVLPMRIANDFSIPGMDARNKRKWAVPSTVNIPTSGGPIAPLQNRGTLWYYPDIFSGYDVAAADALFAAACL